MPSSATIVASGSLNPEQNVTVLLIEQKLAFAQHTGDHFRIMEKGHIVASGAAMASLDEKIISQYLAV